MAVGGYKSVSFSWQGGRTDTPVERTKFVLNGICDAIISANVGWQYDTLTPTSADFLQMPSTDHTNYPNLVKVIKAEYNSHVYRLCFGNVYSYAALQSTTSLKPSDCSNTLGNDYNKASQNGKFDGGLYFCVIKDGTLTTDATYGYIWNEQGEFTKWVTFAPDRCVNTSCLARNVSAYSYSYYFILKNAQIGIFFRQSSWLNNSKLKGFILGDIFKEAGHSNDSVVLGIACLSDIAVQPEFTEPSSYLINAEQGTIGLQPGNDTSNGHLPFQSSIISASGVAYAGTFATQDYKYVYQPYICFDTSVIDSTVSATITSPGGRWTPCWMAIRAADHDTYGVVPGDGFKGYIDTDLLRGVNPNYGYGQQLDGGNFVYLGGGFAIGWDPNNTVLLF